MKSGLLKVFTIAWLLLVTPVLGLLPLLLMFDVLDASETSGLLALALLRDVRGNVLPVPSPDVSHLRFYDLAPQMIWVIIIGAAFYGAGLSLYYWWRVYAKRAA